MPSSKQTSINSSLKLNTNQEQQAIKSNTIIMFVGLFIFLFFGYHALDSYAI